MPDSGPAGEAGPAYQDQRSRQIQTHTTEAGPASDDRRSRQIQTHRTEGCTAQMRFGQNNEPPIANSALFSMSFATLMCACVIASGAQKAKQEAVPHAQE